MELVSSLNFLNKLSDNNTFFNYFLKEYKLSKSLQFPRYWDTLNQWKSEQAFYMETHLTYAKKWNQKSGPWSGRLGLPQYMRFLKLPGIPCVMKVVLHAAGPSWGALGLLTGSLVPHTLCGGNNRAKWETQHWQVPPGDSDMSAVVIKTKHLDQYTAFPWIFFFNPDLQFHKSRIKS